MSRHLGEITSFPLVTAADLVEATSDTGVFVQLSAVLKRTAVKVSAFIVIGNDVTVTMAVSGKRAADNHNPLHRLGIGWSGRHLLSMACRHQAATG